MSPPARLDLSRLPTYGYGAASPMWWGTMGFMAVEGTAFVLAAGMYLYLANIAPGWPLGVAPPILWPGTLQLALLLASTLPNILVDRAARRQDLNGVRLWLVVMCVIGLLAVGIRLYEFPAVQIRWDENAYGSVTWLILGLHMTHLVTDLGDTLVLAALMFTRHAKGKRFSDVSDNAFYWYFVIATWVPLYLLIYWFPRL
jgi:heme/copper-type cytochrome/quinol oxidase subunit 3